MVTIVSKFEFTAVSTFDQASLFKALFEILRNIIVRHD